MDAYTVELVPRLEDMAPDPAWCILGEEARVWLLLPRGLMLAVGAVTSLQAPPVPALVLLASAFCACMLEALDGAGAGGGNREDWLESVGCRAFKGCPMGDCAALDAGMLGTEPETREPVTERPTATPTEHI